MIGVADDYAQHFLCDSFGEKDWNPRKGLKFILPGLTLGLASNLLSYAGLGFSPFPGLQEVALFSAIGLLVAWLTVVLLFPLLLTGFTFDHQPGILKLTTYWEQRWPLWVIKNRRWLGLMLAVFIAGGLWMLTPQDDVRLLQSPPAELLRTADKIRQLFPMSPDNQFFLVSGKDQTDWHQNEQTLLKRLDALKQQKALTAYEGLSDYWPDANQQQQNYQLLKHKLYDSGLLERYMTDLGFDRAAVQAELKQFAEAERNTLALPEWLATADETKQQLWLGCDSGRCQSTVALIGISDAERISGATGFAGRSLGGSGRVGIVTVCALSNQGQRLVAGCFLSGLAGLGLQVRLAQRRNHHVGAGCCAGGFVSHVGLVRSVVQPVQPVCVVAGVGHRRRLRAVLFHGGRQARQHLAGGYAFGIDDLAGVRLVGDQFHRDRACVRVYRNGRYCNGAAVRAIDWA